MRKWIIIGLVVLAGLLAWILVPQRDPVEYHIDGYKTAERRLFGTKTLLDYLRYAWIENVWQKSPNTIDWMEFQKHQRELIRLGFLEERTFVYTNVALSDLGFALHNVIAGKGTNVWKFQVSGRDPTQTNGVRVVLRKQYMPTDEEVLSEIETAKTKR